MHFCKSFCQIRAHSLGAGISPLAGEIARGSKFAPKSGNAVFLGRVSASCLLCKWRCLYKVCECSGGGDFYWKIAGEDWAK